MDEFERGGLVEKGWNKGFSVQACLIVVVWLPSMTKRIFVWIGWLVGWLVDQLLQKRGKKREREGPERKKREEGERVVA